jgi:hypothetical protein
MKTLLLALTLVSLNAHADDIKKDVKMLTNRQENWINNVIKTGAKGAKFEIVKSHTVIDVAPNSEVKVNANETPESIELVSGMARAKVVKQLANATQPKFILKTKAATMGVRGTDFVGISTPILGEAEIIVFDGKVDFTSASDAKDLKSIPPGYWGGIGGRFGAKTHDLIQLPKDTLDYFNKASHVE